MSDAECAHSPDQLNKFQKLTGRPPHGVTLAGRSKTLARYANDVTLYLDVIMSVQSD